MLGICRRHQKRCPRRREGRRYRGCRCPVWVDGHLNGEEINKTLDTRDWQKAQRVVREWEADGQHTSDPETVQPTTIEDAWKTFLADLHSRNLRTSTIRKHKLLSRRYAGVRYSPRHPFSETVRFSDIAGISGTVAGRPALQYQEKLERLRAFFRFAQENKWVKENPASKLKAPKSPQRPTLPFSTRRWCGFLAALDPSTSNLVLAERIVLAACVAWFSCSGIAACE